MKRLFAISFLALTLFAVSAPVFAPIAHAEGGGTSTSTQQTNPNANFDKLTSGSTQAGGFIGMVTTVFAWLLGVAAITLDNAVYYTVVTMGDYVNDLSAVGVAWRVLRDVGNIVLIFGFLAIGISYMLDVGWYGGGTKMLPKLLLVAVFLNFSLFISEAIIDTGNLFATQFYTAINGGKPAAPVSYGEFATEGISNTVLNQLGLQRIYADVRGDGRILEGNHPLLIGFMSIILFMVAAFVFFSLAFILIARFVFLVVLIIVAPIGFVGLAVPKLEGIASKWWGQLIDQTITAPVLLLMLYVALAVITDAQFLTGFGVEKGTAWTGIFVNESGAELADFAGILLSFLVAMGLLLMVTMLAKSLSAAGAAQITKFTSGALTLPFRAGAAYGTGMLGKYAVKGLNDRLRSTRAGRVAGAAASVLTLGALSDYNVTQAAKKLQSAKFGTTSYAERTEFAKSRKTELDSIQRKREAANAIDAALKGVKNGTLTNDQADKVIADNLAKLSEKEISELEGIKSGTEALVRNLSPQQFKNLMDNKEVSDKQKGALRSARFSGVRSAVAAANRAGATTAEIDAARKAIARLNNKELSYIGDDFFAEDFVATNLSNDQAEHLGKEGILSPTQRTLLDSKRKDRFDATKVGAASVAASIKAMKGNRDQIKKVPPTTLADAGVLDQLGADALDVIDAARNAGLSITDRQKLGHYLENIATSPADPRSATFMAYINSDPRVKRDLLI